MTFRVRGSRFCRSAGSGTCLLFSAVLVAGCTAGGPPDPDAAPPSAPASAFEGAGPGMQVETLAGDLDVPWSIAFHGDVPLVSSRGTGQILEIDAAGDSRVVGTIEGVRAAGEGGLLGIAVQDGQLYAYSTGQEGNRIQRYGIAGEPGNLSLGPGDTLLDRLPAGRNHNGGRLSFGPDGMLYATVGDAGDADSAQDLDELSGKILRLTPDGQVPAGNPWDGSPVYSYGHRNPQGLAWAHDGTLFASEFGQNTWDELNIIEPGGNYGWPEVEGQSGREEFINPVQQWEPSEASPSGIAVAGGAVVIANLRGERLRRVPLENTAAATEYLAGSHGRLRDVVRAPDGSLWVLTNNTDGRGRPGPGDDRILRLAQP